MLKLFLLKLETLLPEVSVTVFSERTPPHPPLHAGVSLVGACLPLAVGWSQWSPRTVKNHVTSSALPCAPVASGASPNFFPLWLNVTFSQQQLSTSHFVRLDYCSVVFPVLYLNLYFTEALGPLSPLLITDYQCVLALLESQCHVVRFTSTKYGRGGKSVGEEFWQDVFC